MGLKLPFPKFLAKTDIKVCSTTLGEDGEETTQLYTGKCIYTDKTKQVMNAERQLITLTGKAVIEGDINPGKLIQGFIEVNNIKKNIYGTERPLNPDGTVFSTELSLQ
ncbi:hypothetical protein SAMN02745163_02056 [Clostridium cavendishii DSM 21758]|uniref:Uncharacterized protein n=1 Tax=Clostridium cavendishii DSM 21758 TaxID=1121302 RepID=A0A1M6JZS5_9CLOT|nr:hypothetical protein [Clostridium cavendishii]SHJ52102.1 hypothetical protein SAMN02745163_02056 [Clostridium cavendishii DSM 21758]